MTLSVESESLDGQAYPYRQLDGSDIRYITLKPFDKDVGVVECTIWQKPLEEAQYTAISYAWGDPAITEPILVAGRDFQVTTNLAACLKRLAVRLALRDSAEGGSGMNLWVDAICINQDDVLERNAQVLRMKDIFPHAQELIVWLGDEGPHTGLAVQRINDMNRVFDPNMIGEDGSGFPEAWKEVPEHHYKRTTDKHEMDVRAGVIDIYERDWWERTWILQEVGLCKDIVVHCGGYEMAWDSLEVFLKLARYLMMETPELILATSGGQGMELVDVQKLPLAVLNLRGDLESSYDSRLHILLDNTKGQKATDPRDKVYGILGLSSDFRSGGIQPRYDLPVEDVILDVVKAHFLRYDALDILDQCFFGHTVEMGLPSWRPNWDVPELDNFLPDVIPKYLCNEGEEPKQTFDACGGLSLSSRPWSFGADNTLHLTGACFDTIESVTDMADFLSGWTLESLLKAWLPTVPTPDREYRFAPGTWLDAFRKTVVMDIRFLPAERHFSMVFPDDPDSKDKATFLDRLSEARPSFYRACNLKRLAYTSKGMMGVVRADAKIGDSIAVLAGSKVLHCLREVPQGSAHGKQLYHLIGEAYFNGMMDGEALDGMDLGEVVLA